MLESHDQSEHLISLEKLLVLVNQLLELIHVSLLHCVDDLEVWVKGLLEILLREDLTIWNLSHEELHNQEQLLHL